MAKVKPESERVVVEATLTISELEMRALDALFGYGVEPLLKVFYEHLGQHYMRPYADGLRTLAEVVRHGEVQLILKRAESARRAFKGLK